MELCGLLSQYSSDITPEYNRIDIKFDNWAIELKTVNTNYASKVPRKKRPITSNIKSVLADINNLGTSDIENKAVLFVVFPLEEGEQKWIHHRDKIRNSVRALVKSHFNFKGGIPGAIYIGFL